MTFLIVVACVVAYVVIAAVLAGEAVRRWGEDEAFIIGAVLWPIVLPFFIIGFVVWWLVLKPSIWLAELVQHRGVRDKKPSVPDRLVAWLNREAKA